MEKLYALKRELVQAEEMLVGAEDMAKANPASAEADIHIAFARAIIKGLKAEYEGLVQNEAISRYNVWQRTRKEKTGA